MIGSLTGKIQTKKPSSIVIACRGVGYEVFVTTQTRFDLDHAASDEVTLSTHLVVKEDSHTLFGFSTERDRDLFRVLISANGIGTATGLAILSCYSAGEVAEIIQNEDIPALTRVPRIGKKGAEKMVVELKKKVEPFVYVDPAEKERQSRAETTRKDALDALVALGFKEKDAMKAVEEEFDEEMNASELTRIALKRL